MKNKIIIILAVLIILILSVIFIPKIGLNFLQAENVYEKHKVLVNEITERKLKVKNIEKELNLEKSKLRDAELKKSKIETEIFNLGKSDIVLVESTPQENKKYLEELNKNFDEDVFKAVKKEIPDLTIKEYKEILKEVK